ncbi:hypothetical protein CGRA01v4_14649 [Colletotrichum graminicola]|nr:hypothetical protein CGRA01v4_14649 [Colletotrichum graminicola]
MLRPFPAGQAPMHAEPTPKQSFRSLCQVPEDGDN